MHFHEWRVIAGSANGLTGNGSLGAYQELVSSVVSPLFGDDHSVALSEAEGQIDQFLSDFPGYILVLDVPFCSEHLNKEICDVSRQPLAAAYISLILCMQGFKEKVEEVVQ